MNKRFNIRRSLENLPDQVETTEQIEVVTMGLSEPEPVAMNAVELSCDGVFELEEPSEEAPVFGSVEYTEQQDAEDCFIESFSTAVEAFKAINAYSDIIERSKDRGGLTGASAGSMITSIESIAKTVGMQSPFKAKIGVESFGGVSQRQRSTQVALEEVDGILDRIMTSIVGAISSGAKRIKKFLNSFIFSLRGTQGKLKAAYKSLAEMGDKEHTGIFKNRKALTHICIDGELNIDKALEFCDKINTSMGYGLPQKLTEIMSYVNAIAKNKLDTEKISKLRTPIFKPDEYFSLKFKVVKDHSGMFATYETEDHLPAELKMVFTCPLAVPGDDSVVHSGTGDANIHFSSNPDPRLGDGIMYQSKENIKKYLDKITAVLKKFEFLAKTIQKSDYLIEKIADSVISAPALNPGHLPAVATTVINAASDAVYKHRYRVAVSAVGGVMDNYFYLLQQPMIHTVTLTCKIVESTILYLYQSTKPNLYGNA
jgi:hypothetical protein